MEEKKCSYGPMKGGAAPFVVGFILAIVVGWWIFPQVLFCEKAQPVEFSHIVHVEDGGMACDDCHYFRDDGTYNGYPSTEDCAACHMDSESLMGETDEELKYIQEYVEPGKEVEWHTYQKQPDNVFFSHAVHNMASCVDMGCHSEIFASDDEAENQAELCSQCHPDVMASDGPPVYSENRLTEYSKDTMKMWQCEECHANPDHMDNTRSNNACYTCHK